MGDGTAAASPVPGAVVVWTGSAPTIQALRVPTAGLVIGRETLTHTDDDRISRQHARVVWRAPRFVVTDLGSRNGTYAGGQPLVDREVTVTAPAVVRTGRTVAVLVADVRPFEGGAIGSEEGALVGPSTAPLWRAAADAGRAGHNLVITGEPGTGKGRMARSYARARGRRDAVFNPTIQAVPLDRVVGAQTETLILEQIGKLGAPNLATLVKLLARPGLRVVTTASAPLELLGVPAEVAAALSTCQLAIPPLRARPDELAFLVNDAVRGAEPALQIHSTLVEVCLLRPWPGNARELVAEVSRAAHTVAAQGKNNVRGEDLDNDAGHLMIGAPTLNAAAEATAPGKVRRKRMSSRPHDD